MRRNPSTRSPNAYANDRAEPEFYVSLSSTLQIAWSLSSLVLPAVTSALMPFHGPGTFIYMIMAVAATCAAFVIYRLSRRESMPLEETGPYLQVSAQAPPGPELGSAVDDGAV